MMTLAWMFVGIIIAALFICTAAAIRMSGNCSRDEEAGAPEGWHQPKIN